jgi:hypothetical protein
VVRLGEIGVDAPHAVRAEPQRLDRAPALDRLAQRSGEDGVGGALREVGLRGAPQVPAGADPEDGDAGDARDRGDRADPHRRAHGEHGGDGGDERLGDGEADRPRERVDIGRRPRDEVAGAGPLDGREREREHAAHEVLAELGEDRLGEDERGAAGEPGDHRLDEQEAGEHKDELVDVRLRRPVRERLDELADEPGRGEPGRGGGRVERDHGGEPPAVAGREQPRLNREILARSDGEPLDHAASSSSPRVTVSR